MPKYEVHYAADVPPTPIDADTIESDSQSLLRAFRNGKLIAVLNSRMVLDIVLVEPDGASAAGDADMSGVNPLNPEDCERCGDISDYPCGYHQGTERGFAAGLRAAQAAISREALS